MSDDTDRRRGSLRRWNAAVDIGTANIRVAVHRHGIVYDQPAVIALDRRSGAIVAAGAAAKAMIGRTPPHLVVEAPFRGGGFDDTTAAHHLLARALSEAQRRIRLRRLRVLVSLSRGVPAVASSALARMLLRVGAREVRLIDGLAATALGVGPMRTRGRRMLVANLGAHTSEIALIGSEGIVAATELHIGGDDVDGRIARHIRERHGIGVGDLTAQRLKLAILSVASAPDAEVSVRGWDAATQVPRAATVSAGELRGVVSSYSEALVESVEELIAANPDFPRHTVERGVILAGGTAQLAGVAERIRLDLGLPALLAAPAAQMAVLGGFACLERPRLLASSSRPAHDDALGSTPSTSDTPPPAPAGGSVADGARRLELDDAVMTVTERPTSA